MRRGGPGRPKGAPNKATLEAKAICSALIDDPVYQQKLRDRLHAGELAPAVECMLWYYAKHKPSERMEIDATMRPLVLDRVSTRGELMEALGDVDVDAGDDDID